MLLETDGGAGEGYVVLGREQGDQAKNKAANGLGDTDVVEAEAPEALGLRGTGFAQQKLGAPNRSVPRILAPASTEVWGIPKAQTARLTRS